MLRTTAVLSTLLLCAPYLRGDEATPLTGLQVYEACKRDQGSSSFCAGVLIGFVSGLTVTVTGNTQAWFCKGNTVTLRLGYLHWAERNAAALDGEFRAIAAKAFVDEGFCQTEHVEPAGSEQ